MATSSLSATLMSPPSCPGFDTETYLRCKPFLCERDVRLASTIVEAAKGTSVDTAAFRVLDVGTGDGSLLRRTSQALAQLSHNPERGPSSISITSVDPSPWKSADRLSLDLGRLGIRPQIVAAPVQDFLPESGLYEQITCCHVLYHVSRADWYGLIRSLSQHLSTSGTLVVALASEQSEIYDIWRQLEASHKFTPLDRTFDKHGFEYYAEDFDSELRTALHDWEVKNASGEIRFTPQQVYEARAYLRGSTRSSEVIRFLSFLFRIRETTLQECCDELSRMLTKTDDRNGISFRHSDRVFIYRRT
jgi:hypothetical protein